ncbi:MAG: hypothetical protein KGY74_10690, partial [Candidatus Cloacimonetes bacterium]|nr:hypothetical protein [Candidatus Cloacimonadota bacterium]
MIDLIDEIISKYPGPEKVEQLNRKNKTCLTEIHKGNNPLYIVWLGTENHLYIEFCRQNNEVYSYYLTPAWMNRLIKYFY